MHCFSIIVSQDVFRTWKTLLTLADSRIHFAKPQITAVTGDPTETASLFPLIDWQIVCRTAHLTALQIHDVAVDLGIVAIWICQ